MSREKVAILPKVMSGRWKYKVKSLFGNVYISKAEAENISGSRTEVEKWFPRTCVILWWQKACLCSPEWPENISLSSPCCLAFSYTNSTSHSVCSTMFNNLGLMICKYKSLFLANSMSIKSQLSQLVDYGML